MSLAEPVDYVNPTDNTPRALELARLGYYVHPLVPNTKRPLTDHGDHDATRDEQTILQWWATWPDANIGIALEPSRLLIVAPDCEERRRDFISRNARTKAHKTTRVQTRSGPGHEHWYYRRPADCPVIRICKSADYDLLTEGYIVAAPSIVPRDDGTRGRYVLLSDLQAVNDLADAPSWAVAMLREESTRREARREAAEQLAGGGEDEPPVRLSGAALEWWNGTRSASDRSGTLYAIAKDLYRAGASVLTVATALAERDEALGLHKYTGRTDAAARYLETARKAAAAVEAEPAPATITFDHPESCGADPDCWRRVAEQDQRIAALEEENRQLRDRIERVEQLQRLTMRAQTNPLMKTVIPTALAATFQYESARSREALTDDGFVKTSRAALGEASGRSPGAITAHLDCLERVGLIERRVTREDRDQETDQETGEILRDAGRVSRLEIRLIHDPIKTLEILATIDPGDDHTWGGERKKRITCSDHPNAATTVYRVEECAECQRELDRRIVGRIAPDIRPDDEITPADPRLDWRQKTHHATSNAPAPSARGTRVDSFLGGASCTFNRDELAAL